MQRCVEKYLFSTPLEDGGRSAVRVSVYHADKAYLLSVKRVRVRPDGILICLLVGGFGMRVEDAPRFSQKRLDALAESLSRDERVMGMVELARVQPLP